MAGPHHTNAHNAIFGEGFESCPETGLPYENGSGALSKEQQTVSFLREAGRELDMPRLGECCQQTGREYECGSGALSKKAQTAIFLREASPEAKAARIAAFDALVAAIPAGRA